MTGTTGDHHHNMNGANLHTSSSSSSSSGLIHKTVVRITVLFLGVVAVSCLVLYKSAYTFEFMPASFASSRSNSLSRLYNQAYKGLKNIPLIPTRSPKLETLSLESTARKQVQGKKHWLVFAVNPFTEDRQVFSGTVICGANAWVRHTKVDLELARVLKKASRKGKTVILTTLNDAWAEPGSIFDLFLESFQIGDKTKKLLNNLVIISLDRKAHARCLAIHPHCYALKTEGLNLTSEAYFMSEDYLKMMWRRIEFLGTVLEMGYSFVFTDADIMWLRNPFPRFYPHVDFQIACDNYFGDPKDKNNRPNGGFTYVRSNLRTILFYRFWFMSREAYPGIHDQDVLNKIKNDPVLEEIELKMRFLDTAYFGGFCERSKDFNKVCTMHANCCYGLGTKVHDLKVVLEDWKNYMSLPSNERASASPSWRAPQNCRT